LDNARWDTEAGVDLDQGLRAGKLLDCTQASQPIAGSYRQHSEFSMERLVVAAIVSLMLTHTGVDAASLLSESQARDKAIQILQGDPYGRSAAEVTGNIKELRLAQSGNTKACGQRKGPAWEAHVVVQTPDKGQFNHGVIDGYLALDARSGKLRCANLPLLD
jgi:hypothetical protein